MPSRNRLVALAIAAALPAAASAQQQQEDDRAIQEIIVTATKREASLQDVPFSVAAMTGEQIRDSGSSDLVSLSRNVAGLIVTDLGPGQSQLAIRGISAGQVIRDQPGVKEQVGVYLDESPISVALFTPDIDLFDLERFEVLRGPQGTLFGAGSTAGTLRYITAQPRLGEFEGTAEVSLTDGSDSDFGGSVKGMVNLPISETAALRLVGYYNELAGFIDAIYPDGSVKENVDGGDKIGARVAMLFQPNENLAITPRLIYQKLDTDGFPRQDIFNMLANPFTTSEPPVTIGERQQFIQLEEGLEDDFGLFDLKVEYDFGTTVLTSVSSYTDREVVVSRDATQLTGSVTVSPIGILDPDVVRISSNLIDATDLKAFSQELRLASTGTGVFDWVVGGFYQDVDRKYGQSLPTPGWDAATGIDNTSDGNGNAPADQPFFSRLSYDFKQLALFGEGTYHFNDQLHLTGGLRYYDFEEDRILNFAGAFAVATRNLPGSTSSDGFSPRAILAYDVSETVQLSFQAARGFRLGGINDPLNVDLCEGNDIANFGNNPTWTDEKVWNYEIGAKTQSLDRRVTFNAAVFFTDIDDLQANTNAGSCSSRIVFNVPKARSVGAEVELVARPSDNWDFALSATYADTELRSTVFGVDDAGNSVAIDGLEEGNRLPTAPEFQAAASATYSWPWSAALGAYVNFTVQHVGSSFTQFADQAPGFGTFDLFPFGDPNVTSFSFDPELGEYDIGNLRFGLQADQWEVAAFLNNVWDEEARLSVDTERGRGARVGYLTNQPRTFGVMFRRSF
jgi:iron complex outermembrane receptor protein